MLLSSITVHFYAKYEAKMLTCAQTINLKVTRKKEDLLIHLMTYAF